MCYDRLHGGLEPACAKACPTASIQFGPLDELRLRARDRVEELHDRGVSSARLYLDDENDGIGGAGAFFLLLDEPEVYGLPPDPVVPTRDLASAWRAGGSVRCRARRRRCARIHAGVAGDRDADELRTYYDRPVLKAPTWRFWIPSYFFLGGTGRVDRRCSRRVPTRSVTRGSAAAARVTALAALGGGTVGARRGPRPARTLPSHVARVPAVVADEHGLVAARPRTAPRSVSRR